MNEEDCNFLNKNMKEFNFSKVFFKISNLNYLVIKKKDEWIIKEKEGFSFYIMIHCDKELYESVLVENRENIGKMVILGNSLRKYNENLRITGKKEIPIFNV